MLNGRWLLAAACMLDRLRSWLPSLTTVLPCSPPAAGEGSALAASQREENAALAPLAVATLRALLAFSPDAFRAHLKDFFPLLTALISCEYAPPEVQRALSDLFAQRIGPMLAS